MRKFSYETVSPSGELIKQTIEASSAEEAERILEQRGILLTGSIRAADLDVITVINRFLMAMTSVKPREIILFTKQFCTMFRVGVPILKTLSILREQTENVKLRQTVERMENDVASGYPLSTAFKRHPKIFDKLYCSMIQAGESSGRLPEVMDRLIDIITHEHKVRKDIQSAMTYPAIVLLSLVGVFFALLTIVIPQFATMFSKSGGDLPWQTQACITLHALLQKWWPLILPVFVAIVGGLFFWLRTPHGRYWRDVFILKIPAVGNVIQKSAMSRFTSIFAILQESGVNVLTSVEILTGTIGNEAIAHELESLKSNLQQGSGISAPLRNSKYFTPMVVNMIVIGEESGQLSEMLSKTSMHYDYEVKYAIARMTQLLGPFLILCMAGLIGFFALAIFLPMWDMSATLS